MSFLTKIVSNLFKPTRTLAYPFAPAETPESYRGKVEVDAARCVGCSTCAQVCVSNAIRLTEEENGVEVAIWHAKCTFCGLCTYYCPTDAMTMSNDWELSHRNEHKYAMADAVLAEYRVCVDCGEHLMVPQEDVMASSIIGHLRSSQNDEPRCEKCRRSQKARQITGVRI